MKMITIRFIFFLTVIWLMSLISANAQVQFSEENVIISTSLSVVAPNAVYSADLDNDGDMDVLSASSSWSPGDNKIAWYANDGSGSFSAQQVISTSADGAKSVYACDLDGDGDMDVLSASWEDDKIVWYTNDGSGGFGPQQVITTTAYGPTSIYASDLDGDGDMDVLSASFYDNKIAWYANDGKGSFGAQQVISTSTDWAQSVYACDLDGDGDMDVLSASEDDDKIAWYVNNGSGSFGAQQVITTSADGTNSVYASDLDGDGDLDVISASENDNKIAWYENLISTDIEGNTNNPVNFCLYQNYPNPFNPTTVISYQLPAISDVELSVYNLIGQKVATLASGKQNAGSHQLEWNGSVLASGVYYYQLKAGTFQQVKKMILLK